MRDPETGVSKRFGFVSYDNFESSDVALQTMNGQYLCGKPVDVSYAYKKDSGGERHGTIAERVLAYNKPNMQGIAQKANQISNSSNDGKQSDNNMQGGMNPTMSRQIAPMNATSMAMPMMN